MSHADGSLVIALDIGGSSTKLALVSKGGKVHSWRRIPTQPSAEEYLKTLAQNAVGLQAEAEGDALGIAGGVAGFLDESETLVYNPNLPWLENAPIRETLAQATGLPVHLEMDSNTACAGEYLFGEGKSSQRFLCLTGGTGMAVGMIVGGLLMRPSVGGMGDAGHIVVSPRGKRCTCGGHGCAEAMLSTQELGRVFSQASDRAAGFPDLVLAAQQKDEAALKIVREAGSDLGIFIASLANIFLPDRIAIAGGLSELGEELRSFAADSFLHHAGEFVTSRAHVVRAKTGAHATLLGAAACFFLNKDL